MTKNTIEFSEQPLHDPLTQLFIQDFCNKCSVGADMSRDQFKNFLEKQAVRDALNDRDMDKLEKMDDDEMEDFIQYHLEQEDEELEEDLGKNVVKFKPKDTMH